MRYSSKIVDFCIEKPKVITGVMCFIALGFFLVAFLPSLWPDQFKPLPGIKVDTDPENMLPPDEPARVFHNKMKRLLSLHEIIVVGVVNKSHPNGVFNPESLRNIYTLTQYAKTLNWPDKIEQGERGGVIEVDIIAASTVDNIEEAGLGTVRFEWLMPTPPKTEEEANAIRQKAERIPFLNGTLISEDGKALSIYLPISSKDLSYKIYTKLLEKISTLKGEETYHITGLPVAEDTFGVEMFKQMAISAPVAMLIIFLLMLFFFRNFALVISPMIVAMVSVICTMGLLVVMGKTVHIMSSMIPIFIMPIAVLDSVHILSEFFDQYPKSQDRRATIRKVMENLFTPMLYTTLTTMTGFASLALAPIPPVQTFGLFVSFGVLMAWFWTIAFIPAYIMLIPKKSLENFGLKRGKEGDEFGSREARLLSFTGHWTYRNARLILTLTVVVICVAIFGITRIKINDNPTKWFTPSHPIRVADRVLNDHFGGTYMAYLALTPEKDLESSEQYLRAFEKSLEVKAKELGNVVPSIDHVFKELKRKARQIGNAMVSKSELLEKLETFAEQKVFSGPDHQLEAWEETLLFIDEDRQRDQVFKQPKVLFYIEGLQNHLLDTGIVGKSNSLVEIVKTVHRELLEGKEQEFRIPDSSNAVAQCLITYQSSHRPQDLWHFVTPDYRKASIWIQLKSGDNQDMNQVIKAVEDYFKASPPPINLNHQWFGLTYINVIWQEKMVSGMLKAFLGSFGIVLLMMILLFRSVLWGVLSMIPLTVSIGIIYGTIGLIGKYYDMPVAVLSSLSLGLAIDYAIHFLARSRALYKSDDTWKVSVGAVFGEPARAIARNAIVVGVGFLPLILATLVPYQTVGIFIAFILLTAGAASLLILPAMIRYLEPWLFTRT